MSKRMVITVDNESIIILKKIKRMTRGPKWLSDFVNIELKRHFELDKEDQLEVIRLEVANLNAKIRNLNKEKETILLDITKLSDKAKELRVKNERN